MTVPLNAILRVIPTLDLRGVSKAQNVFHLLHQTSSEQADEDVVDACGEWVVRFYTNFNGGLHEDVSLEKVEVYIRESGEWNPLGVCTPTWAATNTGDPCPSGIAMLLRMYKPRSGYSDKKFISGWVETEISGDQFQSAAITKGEDAVADWLADLTATNGVELQAIYFKAGPELAMTYSAGEVDTIASYQRRRKPGVGLT